MPACADLVKDYISPLTGQPVQLVAAGGICDGRGLAASFIYGASAVWVGTRFVTARESSASEETKRVYGYLPSQLTPLYCVLTDLFVVLLLMRSTTGSSRQALTVRSGRPFGLDDLCARQLQVIFEIGKPTVGMRSKSYSQKVLYLWNMSSSSIAELAVSLKK